MNQRGFLTYAFLLSAAGAAALAGCAGSSSTDAMNPSSSGTASLARFHGMDLTRIVAMTNRMHASPKIRYNKRRSWSRQQRAGGFLTYASDGASGTVDIYNTQVKNGKLYGQITGFALPFGACADASGNVYVADLGNQDVVEFAHGGITPINTFYASGALIGCSVDPTTGNVAVSAFFGANQSSYSGGVYVFPGGSSTPAFYSDPNVALYYPPAYDSQGNLFVQGLGNGYAWGSGGASYLDELPSGGSSLEELSLSGATIYFPGSAQWDGKYVMLTDQAYQDGSTTGLYRVTVSGSTATVVGASDLTDTCGYYGSSTDVIQPWPNGTTFKMNQVLGGNLACYSRFDTWKYMEGGNPKRSLPRNIAPVFGTGQTLSPPK